jgi:hypothetical protein
MAYGHTERNLVLIVAVTGADQIVQALSGFAGQQQPGRHPGTLGSDIG